jgi:hypothetical protein
MTLERWMLNPRARGVKAFWDREQGVCRVALAYAARDTPDSDTFYAHGEGPSPEQACANALAAARSDPFGMGEGL